MQYLQQADSARDAGEQASADSSEDSGQSQAAEQQQTESTVDLSESQQASDDTHEDPATAGVSQSALDYLSGEGQAEAQTDTLSIQDLLNAGGLGAEPTEEEPEKPDKDG